MSLNVGELMVVLGMETGPFQKNIGMAVEALNRFAGVVSDVAKKAILAGSDFNETTNVIQQGFGKGASAAEEWAARSGSAMGRSTQMMREFVSVSQAMLSSMLGSASAAAPLSKSISQLAVDLGSFWNVADADAFNALRSAIAGEAEPMKRFGVVMTDAAVNAWLLKQGLQGTMETMEESSKTLVRYHFLMDKTKVAHGDAKRTAEGFANQMKALDADVKNASTTLGNKLLLETTKWLVLMRNILAEFTKIGSVADKIISASSTIRNFTTGAMAMQGTGLTGMIAGGLVGAQRGEDIRAPSDNIDRGKGHWDRRTGKWVSDESMFQGEEGQRGGLNQNDIKEKAKQQENDKFNRTQSMLDEYSKKSASEFWRRQEEQDRDGELQLAKDREQADKQRDLEAQLYEADLAETAALLKRDRDATEKQDNEERDWRENQNKLMKQVSKAQEVGALNFMKSAGSFDIPGMAGGATEALTGSAVGGGLVSMIAGGIQSFFTAIIDVVKQIGNQAVDVAKSFLPADSRMAGASGKAMAMGGLVGTTAAFPLAPLAAFGAGIFELTKQTKSYTQYQAAMTKGVDKIVQALEPAFQQLMPLAGLFIQLATSIGIFVRAFIPGPMVATWLFNAFKGLAEASAWSIVAFLDLRVGLTALVAEIFELANWMNGGRDGWINDMAGKTGGEAQNARDERDAAIANAHVIMGMTEAGAAALATAEAMDKLTRSTTNMPSGYRVDVAAAQAQDANPSRGGGAAERERAEMQRTIWAKAVEDLGVAASNLAKKSMQVGDYVATGSRPRRPAFAART